MREQTEGDQPAKQEAERQRVAAELAVREKNRVNEKASPDKDAAKDQTQVALITPPTDALPAVKGGIEGAALIKEIKKEMKRLGCYTGQTDDAWPTDDTRSATAKFAKFAHLSNRADEPTQEFLDLLHGRSDRICPLPCRPGFHADGDSCVKEHMNRNSHSHSPSASRTRSETKQAQSSSSDQADLSRRITKGGMVTCGRRGCQTVPVGCHAEHYGRGHGAGVISCP